MWETRRRRGYAAIAAWRNEDFIDLCRQRGQSRLFRLRQTIKIKASAEQLSVPARWRALLDCVCERVVGQIKLPMPPPELATLG